MKIYIAGPMSGLPDFNRTAFQMAHLSLKNDGHTVLSPEILPDGLEQHEYMDICLAMLRCADCIYMLKGWEDSLGAKAEHALADKLGLQIEYQRTMTAEHHCPSCGGIGWSATCDKCIPYQGAIMTTSPLKADSLEKGKLYVIVKDESWMMGNLGEYHSSFPRKSDGEPLHNMVFRDASDGLEMTVMLTDEVLAAAPNGSVLGDTIDLRAAGITVKGDS